jgi:PilZ domain
MSAVPHEPTAAPQATPLRIERRRIKRHAFHHRHRVLAGRGEGTIRDLGRGGMRIRHTGALARGSQIRVAFEWKGERFAAVAEVLASRVVSIDADGTTYDSRLRFTRMSRDAHEVLLHVLRAMSGSADA